MKAIKIGLLVLLLAVALLAVMVWTAPAELAYRYVQPRLGTIAVSGISGSLWQGQAQRVSLLQQPLGALDWQIDRWNSLLGNPSGRVNLRGAQIRGGASFAQQGDILRASAISGEFPASLLAPALDIPGLLLLGTVSLDFPQAELEAGVLKSLDGRAVWRDLGITGGAEARMPGIEAIFKPAADGSIEGSMHDLGGTLAVDGRVVLRDGRFHTETKLWLREPNPALEEALKFVGERTADGGSLLRIDGELQPLR
jgi:general secretion pathway protein N